MRRLFDVRSFVIGTAIALGSIAISFALAVIGFENVYYASVFMPFAMLCCVALAWFSFLRDDGFTKRQPDADQPSARASRRLPARLEPRPAEPVIVSGIGIRGDTAEANGDLAGATPGGLDASLYAPRDGSIVARRSDGPDGSRPGTGAVGRAGSRGRAALLWAAIELGGAAALLYSATGLGSRFYR